MSGGQGGEKRRGLLPLLSPHEGHNQPVQDDGTSKDGEGTNSTTTEGAGQRGAEVGLRE